jgi:hypothetical protein
MSALRLDDARLERLQVVCQLADDFERMRDELAKSPATVSGSMGQPVAHPLLAESRYAPSQSRSN